MAQDAMPEIERRLAHNSRNAKQTRQGEEGDSESASDEEEDYEDEYEEDLEVE